MWVPCEGSFAYRIGAFLNVGTSTTPVVGIGLREGRRTMSLEDCSIDVDVGAVGPLASPLDDLQVGPTSRSIPVALDTAEPRQVSRC